MHTDDDPDALLGAATVARWLNVSISCVYDQAARGQLPHVRLWKGARRTLIRFRRADIERLIRDRSIAAYEGKR